MTYHVRYIYVCVCYIYNIYQHILGSSPQCGQRVCGGILFLCSGETPAVELPPGPGTSTQGGGAAGVSPEEATETI